MSDLISRSALIEAITDVEVAWDMDGNYATYDSTSIVDIINGQPTVEAKPEWILVEDRLPEDDYDTVLCVQEDRYYFVAVYTKKHGFRTEDFYGNCDSIVAWKPIIPFDFADMRGEKMKGKLSNE